ncbi:peptidoglycan-binding domain-containing protein [Nocardia fusca]|uniref:peptidoglycan-binding domain-containing protein n=1 Tax=Nocardia fusca TaxID=941183 RepID=UPI001E3A5D40|nr:peptidoglycan-binding domain-containing protein [Nocardia fusca]
MSTTRLTGRTLRAVLVAGIALSIASGSAALAQAQSAPATSGEQDTAHACASSYPTLSRGSTGDCVYVVQKALYLIGFRGTPLDGVFGPVTEQTVREYQKSAGIKADGIVGPDTWAALIGESALAGR